MNKKYQEYAERRRGQLDQNSRVALSVFSAAYELAGTLLAARQQCSMTQRELSEISGVAQADISRFERGVITPTVPTLLRLVSALGGTVSIVFDEGDADHRTSPRSRRDLSSTR